MTTFQAVVYGIIHGFAEFLPIGSGAHQLLVPYVLNWPAPTGPLAGALALGAVLSLLVYFRHDWASIISSFIQVIIFRKKPMTLDERLPIFLAITTLPSLILWTYTRHQLEAFSNSPLLIAGSLAFFGLPLWFSDSLSRRTKGMFDWNWLDSLLVGIGQAFLLIPGCGRATGALTAGLFRNFNREAIAKYTFFAGLPVLVGVAFHQLRGVSLHAAAPAPDLSWFSFGVAFLVTFVTGLLAIGGFMKNIVRKGFSHYAVYRLVAAVVVVVVFFLRARNGG